MDSGSLQQDEILNLTWTFSKEQDEALARTYLKRESVNGLDLIPMLMEPITNVRRDASGFRTAPKAKKATS